MRRRDSLPEVWKVGDGQEAKRLHIVRKSEGKCNQLRHLQRARPPKPSETRLNWASFDVPFPICVLGEVNSFKGPGKLETHAAVAGGTASSVARIHGMNRTGKRKANGRETNRLTHEINQGIRGN